MAALGGAKSNNFQIGVSELRIGELSDAGRLTQANSVGLLQSATITTTKTFAELRQGELNRRFYQKQTGVDLELSANLYEFTARNLQFLAARSADNLSYSPEVSAIKIKVTSVTNHNLATGSLETEVLPASWATKVTTSTAFSVGVYLTSKPQELYTAKAFKKVGNTLVLETSNLRFAYEDIAAGTELFIYPIQTLSLGSADDKFYTVDVVSKNQSSGVLKVFRLWKVGIQSGLEFNSAFDAHGSLPFRAVAFDLDETELLSITDEAARESARNNPLGTLITL